MHEAVIEENDKCIKAKSGISGSTIKIIAMVSMLIDHIAATILQDYIVNTNVVDAYGNDSAGSWITLYYVMRLIGRIAFPIYAFLLVEGYSHTRNKWRYLLRLIGFAFVSEIPFDLAFVINDEAVRMGKIMDFSSQNVFFTLAVGLLVVILADMVNKTELNRIVKCMVCLMILAAGALLAYVLKTDYALYGVVAIFIIYMLRKIPAVGVAAGCAPLIASTTLEITALLACIPVAKYNGTRGLKLKWVFYLFYPVHLLMLWWFTFLSNFS